ncbi:MAG: hypothetical protein QF596_07580 [Acidimicrobiales bacterium]|jgi:acyl dehydratase|nr:hypothetical protein [Acidimicrobiales bacterium]MDP6298621.1 hypothetical protein [Acidimicrobiales bacterium]HJM27711.1 hypothetical protein [Acidimicrobiales bacterium]HJM98467.1 hypothetical protein [Acidimicrobiales bacterium]
MNKENDGPFYEDMEPGMVFPSPPPIVVDSGMASTYQSIVGEALPLVLDSQISKAVTGMSNRMLSPGLLLHLSIGASTVATKKVIANLFYRDVRILRPVYHGETLLTTTEVVAMQDSKPKENRPHRGKVLLKITTRANNEPILEYYRCPLVRLRGDTLPGYNGDLGETHQLNLETFKQKSYENWDLTLLDNRKKERNREVIRDPLKDVVNQALGLVRLTQNVAAVHRDSTASPYPQRLVYGGHTVALAQASLSRVFPNTATVLGWHMCDHTGPVFEGDLLSFEHRILDENQFGSGNITAIRSQVYVHRENEEPKEVLDWVPVTLTR